jgi:hypothetical protein
LFGNSPEMILSYKVKIKSHGGKDKTMRDDKFVAFNTVFFEELNLIIDSKLSHQAIIEAIIDELQNNGASNKVIGKSIKHTNKLGEMLNMDDGTPLTYLQWLLAIHRTYFKLVKIHGFKKADIIRDKWWLKFKENAGMK